MYSAIAANKRNTVIIIAVFLLLIGGIAWFVGYYYDGNYLISIYALVIAIIYVLFEYFAAGHIAMTMNGAREIERKDCPLLWNAVENITISEGLPMPKVYVINDPAPNAFATGRDPKHAMVAATTGLLEIMNKRELTAIMAHEMGHVKNYDIRVSMIVFGLVSIISIICDLAIRITFFGGGNRSSNSNGRGPLELIGLIAVILAPIVAVIIQLAVSRQREYLADASSAMITRDPDGMVMALEKLRDHAQPMQRQNTSTAHLFIANPLKSDGFMSKIFSTHPPIEDRIARLQKNAERM
jgi:heat shock protein HtpX